MNDLVVVSMPALPQLVVNSGDNARTRFIEFFTANIRNGHTRRAHGFAAIEFIAWCEMSGLASLADVQPVHAAAYIELLGSSHAPPRSSNVWPLFGICSTGW